MENNTHKVLITLGTRDGSTTDREENDFYATSPVATTKMVNWLKENVPSCVSWRIWEPCCGTGRITKVFEDNGLNVTANTDLIDRGFGESEVDFLTQTEVKNNANAIVTNPPYKYALEMNKKAIELLKDGEYYVFLGRIQYLEGKERQKFFKENPPRYVLVHSERVNCWKDDKPEYNKKGKEISSAICYAWFVFRKGYNGKPEIAWL